MAGRYETARYGLRAKRRCAESEHGTCQTDVVRQTNKFVVPVVHTYSYKVYNFRYKFFK